MPKNRISKNTEIYIYIYTHDNAAPKIMIRLIIAVNDKNDSKIDTVDRSDIHLPTSL